MKNKNFNGGFVNIIVFIIVAVLLLYFFGARGYDVLIWIIDGIRNILVALVNVIRQLLS